MQSKDDSGFAHLYLSLIFPSSNKNREREASGEKVKHD